MRVEHAEEEEAGKLTLPMITPKQVKGTRHTMDKERNSRKQSEYGYEFRSCIFIHKTRLQEARRKRELKRGLSNKQGHN